MEGRRKVTEIIIGILSLIGTLVGAYFANRRSAALIAYRIEELEKKVNRHNQVIERTYKLEEQGKQFIKIDKWFPSSQMCHECGCLSKKTKDLSVREWTCPHCGATHNRDYNAAINIKNEAVRIYCTQ